MLFDNVYAKNNQNIYWNPLRPKTLSNLLIIAGLCSVSISKGIILLLGEIDTLVFDTHTSFSQILFLTP